MTIDVAGLKARTDIAAVIGSFSRLTRDGKTWRGACPVHGGDGQNLVVYPDSGSWHCFSCNCQDGHSDVIGFIELMLNLDFQRAAEYLGAEREWKPELVKPARAPMPERITCKPPAGNEPKSMKHFTFGEPETVRRLNDLDGSLLGFECRYARGSDKDEPDKSPSRMWTWGARGTEAPAWGMGQFSTETALRPLYGLDRIGARPDAPFALFEGPKKADAAQVLIPIYNCIAFHGGANAWKRIDFSVLRGKKGLLWPDSDRKVVKTAQQAAKFGLNLGDLLPYAEQPGPKAMLGIGQMLSDPNGLNCKLRIVDVWKDCEMPDGWDIADALADGWTTQQVVEWAKPRTSDVIPIKGNDDERTAREIRAGMPGNVARSAGSGTFGGEQPEGSHQGQVPDMHELAAPGDKGLPSDNLPALGVSPVSGQANPPEKDIADSSAAQEPQPLKPVIPLPDTAAPTLEPSITAENAAPSPQEPPGSSEQPPPAPPLHGTTAERPPRKPRKPYIAASGGNVLPEPELDDAILPLELSEIGVAARFCDLYHEDFRVVHEWGGKHGVTWLAWDGTRWKKEPTRKTAYQKMSLMCCGLKYHEAARGMTEFAKAKFERAQFISSCLNQAQFDARIIAPPDVWDANPLMLGTPAGVVDLAVGQIIEADRDQFITRQTAVAPVPGPHPLFDSVIERIGCGDAGLLHYIWKALGYSITGDQREENFWFLYGKPQSGKTTFIEAVAAMLGHANEGGYATTCDMDLFVENKNDRGNERLAELSGARFVYASETEEGRNWKAALLKLAVGGDTLRGRMLYENAFSFRPTHHLWIFGNSRPHLKSKDDGIKRRLHLVEYPGVISDEERDNSLKSRLVDEYPAILHSMILACIDWQNEGLGKPESVSHAVETYLEAEDTLGAWIEECCERNEHEKTQTSAAYISFKRWAEASNEYVLSQKRFTGTLEDRGFPRVRYGGKRYLGGFKLKQTDDERSPPSYDRD